jgi:ribose transport system substrate-binding protein
MKLRTLFAASLVLSFAGHLLAGSKVGLLVKAHNVGIWAAVEKGAAAAAAKADVDLTVRGPLTESDVGVQIRLLNALAAQGMQAIIIAPINKEALAVPIASIAVKGVKIVVIDTPITGSAAPVFIGTDHEAAGRAAGTLLAKLVGPSDEAALFKHSQSSGATVQRDTGALAGYRAVYPNGVLYGDIYASTEPGAEKEHAETLLKTHPNVKAILATGTAGTLAMLDVLKQKDLAGSIKLVGFGFNLNPRVADAIDSGAMAGWIAQLPNEIGAKGVEAAVRLLNGETVPPVIHTDVVVVTKENLKDPKIQALLTM